MRLQEPLRFSSIFLYTAMVSLFYRNITKAAATPVASETPSPNRNTTQNNTTASSINAPEPFSIPWPPYFFDGQMDESTGPFGRFWVKGAVSRFRNLRTIRTTRRSIFRHNTKVNLYIESTKWTLTAPGSGPLWTWQAVDKGLEHLETSFPGTDASSLEALMVYSFGDRSWEPVEFRIDQVQYLEFVLDYDNGNLLGDLYPRDLIPTNGALDAIRQWKNYFQNKRGEIRGGERMFFQGRNNVQLEYHAIEFDVLPFRFTYGDVETVLNDLARYYVADRGNAWTAVHGAYSQQYGGRPFNVFLITFTDTTDIPRQSTPNQTVPFLSTTTGFPVD